MMQRQVQEQSIISESSSSFQQSSASSMRRMETQQASSSMQTHVSRQVIGETKQVQGMVIQSPTQVPAGRPADASPPVFEQIFRNARFAQGGNALFEGKVRGSPQPQVVWTRKGSPIQSGEKYKITVEPTGKVSLLICSIGPGDEGEYTCTALNPYGEAICTVYIQPEATYSQFMQEQQMQAQHTSQAASSHVMQTQMRMQQESVQRSSQTQAQFQQFQRAVTQRGIAQDKAMSYTNGTVVEEDFKVDTFEYRLLREMEFRETLTKRTVGETETETEVETETEQLAGPLAPPVIQQKPRNSKLLEGSDATFQAKISGNPKPRLTWFKNGQRIRQSQRFHMSYSNEISTLKIRIALPEDTGHYTLLAENAAGCVVFSAYLAIEATGMQAVREGIIDGVAPGTFQPTRPETGQVLQTEPVQDESGKSLSPNFLRVCGDKEVTEGKMVRFDCRISGRPYPDVTWYLNGQQVTDDLTHKVLVNEAGNHALMITSASMKDNGILTCVARNKSGESKFQCNIAVIEKAQVVAPKFVERFTTVKVKEGEPVTLSARAVGSPIPRITWQKDGVPIVPSAEYNIFVDDEGGSTLDIPYVKSTDAAWYQCTAQNAAGSTATRARLYIDQPSGTSPTPRKMHFAKPTKIIAPEREPEPEVIFLRHVERTRPQQKRDEEERTFGPPQFTHPLRDFTICEGQRAHFETKITPVGDPTMLVEWFFNGKTIEASSRATVTCRFGYIALDLLNVVIEDHGVYTCKVTNEAGTAECSATLTVSQSSAIELSSLHPDSVQAIHHLEDYSVYKQMENIEETVKEKPAFVRPLVDLGEKFEGTHAHFEAQLIPVNDSTMKVEWYKDGKTLTASSRITTIFNFGYVSLSIMHLRPEDSGTYTVRAVNKLGEAVSKASIRVATFGGVTGDLGIPEQQMYIEKVEEFEAYQLQKQMITKMEEVEKTIPPEFKSPIKDQINIREGAFAHFEARLQPVGDPSLKVEWYKDGKPVEASSRITSFFNFGYVALTIKQVATHDSGTYSCRAFNQLGEATTSAQLLCISKKDILIDSQHPEGLEKIQYLEDTSRYARAVTEEIQVTKKPTFVGPLKGTNRIVEGQRAHFEVKLEPQNDSQMRVDWYFNGKAIMSASRIKIYHDFGYVALDILDVRQEDTGTYIVHAKNALGEAELSAHMTVEQRASVDTQSMHKETFEKTAAMEGRQFHELQYEIEEISKSPPIFVQPLTEPKPILEGKNIHLEGRLEPMGDPTMNVEWFFNGRPITVGSRFRTYYDFGFVALDIVGASALDVGEYTVRASNHLGSAHTSACVNVISESHVQTETQHEAALEQIQFLEDSSRFQRLGYEEMVIDQAPVFTRPLHNIETVEGTNIHLECRVQPVGDSTMRIEWIVNGEPLKTGHRFRPAFDFDYVALDILSVYPDDSGVYTCRCINQLGEAVSSATVKCIAKKDLVLDSQHPAGLQQIQYLEDSSHYKRAEWTDEVFNIKPKFVSRPKNVEGLKEGQNAHFEAKLEPVTDPNLKVEWFRNGRPITVGHRFRPIHDFGYVALDIINVIEEDSGQYTCRAVNLIGVDEVTCSLSCKGGAQIVMDTQHEMGLEQIHYLEDKSRYSRAEITDELTTQSPIFTTSLKNIEIMEGQRAHFECRLIPVSDPNMKVEWFHNQAPVKSGARFTETTNFGFVALDIMYAYAEDSGMYTCRATNVLGQAVTQSTLLVHSKKAIYRDTQHESALTQIQYLEDQSRFQKAEEETIITQAPVFTQPIRDLVLVENQSAHFEGRLIPVGDPKLKVEWLKNGIPIQASSKVNFLHDFGYVAFDMKFVYPEDSGTYTCKATNELGEAVTSASLIVSSKASLLIESQHEDALQKIQYLEDSSRHMRTDMIDTVVTEAPKFVSPLRGANKLVEGQSAHFECRVEPYPDSSMKVEWLHNNKPLPVGHRFRTTYDFGFAALDILSVYPEDSGRYTVQATNILGTQSSSIDIEVKPKSGIVLETQHLEALEKIQTLECAGRYRRATEDEVRVSQKPAFGRPLRNIDNIPEGQSAHLEATLTPVNDPTMKVEWFYSGQPIPHGHRFKSTYDFGYVALDILYIYPEDQGTYMCKATNSLGEAVTTCSVTVEGKAGLELGTLDADRLKKIRELEEFEHPKKVDVELPEQKPVFTTPLNSLENLKEGDHAHLECRLQPINDPKLKVEWYINGVTIKTGHRFRTTHDFGYVALDILYTYHEDSGTYMCKASNAVGEAVNTCTIAVSARRSIYLDTHHPEGLEKIRHLEMIDRSAPIEIAEVPITPPRFISELQGPTELVEGNMAHLEARVQPIHDSNLHIEFYHNDKPLPSAARFHITFDFGYVALDIQHLYPEDAGKYTCKALNALGEATSTININVRGKSNVILDTQHPEGLEKIRELEDRDLARPSFEEPKTFQRPVFTAPLCNIDSINEGETAHFECRLIPVGDPTLRVEWFRNEKPLETSSRIHRTHDFGYVALDISTLRPDDEGVYECRASNKLGEAVTTASIKIKSKASILLDTQHPAGMKKIRELEDGKFVRQISEKDKVYGKPVFTSPLTGPAELIEGQHAHFECRVVPVGDPNLKFEWHVNGVELKMGSRFRVTQDFGYVTLDVNSTIPEDSGVYMCKAYNLAGEAVSTCSMRVRSRQSVLGDTMHEDAWQKIQLKEAEMNRVPEMFIETRPEQAPVFTTHLASYDKLVEGQNVHLEAQVEPRADPNLKVEWYKNGIQLMTGSRMHSSFDFGLVNLDLNGLRPDDSGLYTCKAYNLLGEAVSTCSLKVEELHWLQGGSLRPEVLPKIEDLEQPRVSRGELPEAVYESPVFVSHINNVECKEGERAHFEGHVEPSKDPTLNVEWYINGKPLPSGARFTTTYDFGFVALDVMGTYPEDSGVYMCKTSNEKGQAISSGTLKVHGKDNIYFDTQHPQGMAGLEAVQEAEAAFYAKYQRQMSGPSDAEFQKPLFSRPLQPTFNLSESEPLHLECQVEPKQDPNLKVEWFFSGKHLEHGSRFKITSDFGFVTLDLSDVYPRDQGIYTCKAYNLAGEAFTSTTIYCTGKRGVIEATQHPKGEVGIEAIQHLEDSLRLPEQVLPDEEGQPPRFTSQFQNLTNLSEGDIAHFEASLTPAGDQTMTVEWFFNGETLKASHRTRTVHAFGMVVLEILGTKVEDSGTYTCKAKNKWGEAEISVTLECIDRARGQKPQFTSQIQDVIGLKDGESAHFECHLVPVGDPHMKVEWFHNGHPMQHSSRMKTVCDFGYVVLDIAYVQSQDSGEYVCKAVNKYGQDTTKAVLQCSGKGGVYLESLQPESLAKIQLLEGMQAQPTTPVSPGMAEPPKFITQIADITQLVEGQSAHFEAKLKPVGDPELQVEWYKDGKRLPTGHRFRTFHDFGIVILDILYCYEEDSGLYECRAVNKLGQDATKSSLKCVSKANLILTPQIPKSMEAGLEKIQSLEDAHWRAREGKATEMAGQAPRFTVPLSNIDELREGENAHFEARLVPTDDPQLKVDWYWNGKPIKTGSRFRTFCDFGFVILEISPVYPEDSGEYSCRANNLYGEAVTNATLKCSGKRSIILESQLPKGMERTMEKIAELEGLGFLPAATAEEELGKPPEFITTPSDLTLAENSLAHFECKVIPINDPSMRVEWFHNGKPLAAGSRIKTINDFGYVILEVAGVYQRDAGLYTCKATNRHGEATVSSVLHVKGRQGIILEPQLPHKFLTGTESIQKLEDSLWKREEATFDEEKPAPPHFVTEIQDNDNLTEGAPAHFECRVEPLGDPSMRIEWFWNGRPLHTGSRFHSMYDFGFVVLDIDWTYPRDCGEYVCRATNKWGSAKTTATLVCKAKRDIILDTQLPVGMSPEKLKELERGPVTQGVKDEAPIGPPKFITQLQPVAVGEGDTAHFECRVQPKNDGNLRVEWFHSGKPLQSGHRFHTTYDFGFVALDILYAYAEDSGEYSCKACNSLGEDITKTILTCKELPAIMLQNQIPKGMQKSDYLVQMEAALKKYTTEIHLTAEDIYDAEKKQPPRFVTHIKDQTELKEMQSTKFECQLAPVGDPNMKVEWFFNGRPLPYKNRFTPIYDFGYVAMNFGWVYPEDSGEYMCRATNLYGSDETRAIIKTLGKPGIIYESQLPKGMKSIEKIRTMEAAWQRLPEVVEDEPRPKQKPVFVTTPEPCTVIEGEMARFCCRVTGYPKPRVMWLVNSHTVMNGTRYRLTYDGMWHLDIPKTRQYDSGKVEVIARNSSGEAYTSTELVVKPREDDYRAVLKTSPKRDYLNTKEYRKPEWVTRMEQIQAQMRATQVAPTFTKKLTDMKVRETESVTFEAHHTGKPAADVSWYHEDKLLKNSRTVQIRIMEKKTTCTLINVDISMKGKYTCRAFNSAGEHSSSANLEVIELSEEEKKALVEKKAKELEELAIAEKNRAEREKLRKVKKHKTEQTELEVKLKKGEPAVQLKKVTKPEAKLTKMQQLMQTAEVKEILGSVKAKDFNPGHQALTEIAVIAYQLKQGISVTEIMSSYDAHEFPALEKADSHMAVAQVVDRIGYSALITEVLTEEALAKRRDGTQHVGFKALLKCVKHQVAKVEEVITHFAQEDFKLQRVNQTKTKLSKEYKQIQEAQQMEETLEQLKVKQFGVGEAPLRELAKVSLHLKHGTKVTEVISAYDANEWPALKKVEAQMATAKVVERMGHSALVTQVLTEEIAADREATENVGFKALMKVVGRGTARIENILTRFNTSDFQEATVKETHNKLLKEVMKLKEAKEVEEKLKLIKAKEFGPGMAPMKEMAKIEYRLNHGTTVTEVNAAYEASEFPNLKKPEAQMAVAQVFERVGHSAVIHEVLTEEIVAKRQDVTENVGFKAFMKVVEQEGTVKVSQVMTKFQQDDFKPEMMRKTKTKLLQQAKQIEEKIKSEQAGKLEYTKPQEAKAGVGIEPQEEFKVVEVVTGDWVEQKLVPLQAKEAQAKLKREREAKDAVEVQEMLKFIKAKDFGPGERPLAEIAKIGVQLRHGTKVTEVNAAYDANEFPTLKAIPEAQAAMVQLADRVSLRPVVTEVLTEEVAANKEHLMEDIGFKALMKLVEGESVKVEEVITSFMPEDFAPTTLEKTQARLLDEVTTLKRATSQVTEAQFKEQYEFIQKLQDLEVKETESAILCVEVSSETVDVTWHKDGEELLVSDERFSFIKEGKFRKIVINKATVHDEGEYTCALAEQECTAELTVVELPPEMTTTMKDVTVTKGERGVFEIELTKGDALVRWFKDGVELQFSEHIQLAIDGKRQRLMIYNSTIEDCGEYSCIVGKQTSTAKLKVEEPSVDFVTKLPNITSAPQNTEVMFTVELSKPDAEVKWLRNGKEISEDMKFTIIIENTVRKLVLKDAVQDDQAEYSCVCGKIKTSSKLKVEVIEMPPQVDTNTVKLDYTVKTGEDVTITVPFKAVPTPKAEWYFKGKLLKKSKKVLPVISEVSASITIRQIQDVDCGCYTLKLSNNCGDVSVDVTLKILEKPSQPGTPEPLQVTNESVTLHWKKPENDGNSPVIKYILEYHEKTEFKWIEVDKEVTITETSYIVTKLVYNAEYIFRVTAVNSVGSSQPSSESGCIKITEPVTPEPPQVVSKLESVVIGLNKSVTLSCVISGVPTPVIKWSKDGRVLKSKDVSYENNCAKYIIQKTTKDSSGIYACVAENEAGFAETSCTIKIVEPPKIEVDEKLRSQMLRVGTQWKIQAKYSGYPKPEVGWTKNGEHIESSKHTIMHVDQDTTDVAIYSLTREDTATYTLVVKNKGGSASMDFSLRVVDKPSKPEGPIVIKDVDKASVKIEWKPPADDGGMEISGYLIEKCDIKKKTWMKVADTEGSITSYSIQDLLEGSEYMFRIIAENPIGKSEALESDAVLIKSKFDKPSPPRGPFEVSGMTDTSFTLGWLPSESDGGSPITEYIIERREVKKKAWQRVGATDSETTNIECTLLKKGVQYHFRVTAKNDVGPSQPYVPEEAIAIGKRLSPPTPPTNLTVTDITSRSVTLQWGPPANTGGAELTGYIIEKCLSGTDTWEKVVTLETSVTLYMVMKLKEKSEYQFRIRAENSIGMSNPAETEIVALKTHATPPSPPTAPLEIRPTGPNTIIIEWGIPESDGGAPIEGYRIAIRDVKKTMWMEVGQVGADFQKLIVSDLQEGNEYFIRIFARNEVGMSDPLESEEPVKVIRPADYTDSGKPEDADVAETPSLSFSTTDTLSSWMREASMDADISSYAISSLLRRDEYFFRIWHYARQLFK